MPKSFKYLRQKSIMDCGPTCLSMVSEFYGKHFNIEKLREKTGFGKSGTSLLGISEAADNIGFNTKGVKISIDELFNKVSLPAILHWNQNHFVVLPPNQPFLKCKSKKIIIADPAIGKLRLTQDEFLQSWLYTGISATGNTGVALLLEPTQVFFKQIDDVKNEVSWKSILLYISNYKNDILKVFVALTLTSFFQLLFPFLTQAIADEGINSKNLSFVKVILSAQLMIIFSRSIIDYIKTRILLNISAKLTLHLSADFWIKLTKLPIIYFQKYQTGDTLQRIQDSKKVESILSGNLLSSIFSIFNFIIFSFILIYYSNILFVIFCISTILYFGWVQFFLQYRKKLNFQTFNLAAKENSLTIEFIQGMQELKLRNAENIKRLHWEELQVSIFNLRFKSLNIQQLQNAGALFLNEGKNVIITFIVAKLVIAGELSFGAMLAIQYIIAQLNNPIEQFIALIQNTQDVKMSMERLNEIHSLEDEESNDKYQSDNLDLLNSCSKSISFRNVSFTYPGPGNESVLTNISFDIPEGKTTAIVGMSGSGKTTILKLLLKFYENYEGDILIGNEINFNSLSLKKIKPSIWRSNLGSVLQDGYIFNDSIVNNIAVGDGNPDMDRIVEACKSANILSFILSLPNDFNTMLGNVGVDISQGQKQRIMIARAIYRNPHYLLFDEATNALDTNNEKTIVQNLTNYSVGRTVIIVAHRLSTVKNADNIIVLDNGRIVECGNHDKLCDSGGKYFELVRDQLELGG